MTSFPRKRESMLNRSKWLSMGPRIREDDGIIVKIN
jgi:hypothetical protein